MIIDAHHHLWDVSRGYTWLEADSLEPIRRTFTMADLRPSLAATGVSRTILVEAGRGDAEEVNEFLAIAQESPEIAGVVGWCDLANPQLPESPLLVGARSQVQAEKDPRYLGRRDVRKGLRKIEAAGLAFDLVVRVDQLKSAADAAASLPGLTFVLDHLGKPSIRDGERGLAAWRETVKPLADLPNVYAKLSGLVTEADWAQWRAADLYPFVSTALDMFGPDRLMFGSDWPVCLLAASYEQVFGALDVMVNGLSMHERESIFSGTAIRVYHLNLA